MPSIRVKMIYYTYAYLREDRTPYYIGKGKGRRVYENKGRPCNKPSKDRIIFLKQNLTEDDAFKHEKYMIAIFGRIDLGTGILYNKTDGGEGPSGFIHSEETKIKLSESKMGEKNHFYGKKHSEKTKRKISKMTKGRKYPRGKNHPNYGKKQSKETRRKNSESKMGEKNHFYGKSHSEESKRKLSETKKGRKWWNNGLGKSIQSKECPDEGWVLGRGKLV